ncbi:MAG: hypothetical protein IIV43_02225 [Oscillospiraceae bacterium]|nr:hypothetical protein [Oscillospiraceae bacterium]
MYKVYTQIKDPKEEDPVYADGMATLDQVKRGLPQYDAPYAQSLQDLYRQITERPKFTYDPDGDALYQSYKQAYAQQGRLAMEDAMGQAAGLTGGYATSYGQAVGQQQYDAYLQKLGEVYPELYSMAYGRYLDEGAALQQQYDMMFAQSEADYERYLDRLALEDLAYNREMAAEKDAYNKQQKAYDRLVDMMTTMGYVPTAEELAAAGMSEQHKEAYLNYFNSMLAAGGGSGGRGGKKDDDTDAYDAALQEARAHIAKGMDVETVNGEIAQKVARGELDVETARRLITALTKAHYG